MNTRSDQLEVFLREDPSNALLACDLADELLASGRIAHALGMLEQLPGDARHQHGVRFRMARCQLALARPAEAVPLLRALIDEGVDVPALHHDLAFAEFCLGHLEAAAQALQPALLQTAPTLETLRLHARILHWQGSFDGALHAIDNALEMASADADALGIRALVLLDTSRNEEAALAAQASLAINPSQVEAGIVAGTLALWQQRAEDAIVAFGNVIHAHPKAGRALAGQGQAHMLRGDIATARTVLEQAVAWMPNHIGTWHALAWCQLLLGEVVPAQASYQRAFALDRGFGETHGGLAVIHALRGEAVEAEAAIVRARRLDPNGRSAAYAQGLLLLDAGREDEARQLIEPILRSTPQPQDTDAVSFLRALRAQMTRT